jgi:hypothetical protein
MNILIHIFFTVLFLAVVLHGQGAGGGDRAHGGRGDSRDGSYDGKYRDDSRDGNYDGKYRDGSRDGKFGGGGSRHSYSDYPKESKNFYSFVYIVEFSNSMIVRTRMYFIPVMKIILCFL